MMKIAWCAVKQAAQAAVHVQHVEYKKYGAVYVVSVKVDVEKCTGCGTCVDVCPVEVFELQETAEKMISVVVAEDNCLVCQACVLQCNEGAIEVIE